MAPAAGSALVDVARTVPDKALRTQAVDELAGRPDSAQFLEELLDGSGPRLPWRLRRHVRLLLKARGAP
jgi:hypothetical protein